MATEYSAGDGSRRAGILKGYLPIVQWLPQYQLSWVPSALAAVALAVIAVILLDLDNKGVKIVGSQEAGLPPFGIPRVSLADLKGLIPGALAIVLLGYAESLGAAKAATAKLGGKIDPNQELVSYGPANLGSAFSSGFVVVGSLSKTSVAMSAGGKTQLSSPNDAEEFCRNLIEAPDSLKRQKLSIYWGLC